MVLSKNLNIFYNIFNNLYLIILIMSSIIMDNILYRKVDYNELKQFIEKYNIDLKYDEYDYINIISSRDDIKLLELFIDHNADIHYNDDELLD